MSNEQELPNTEQRIAGREWLEQNLNSSKHDLSFVAACVYRTMQRAARPSTTEARMLELARDMDSGGIWEDAAFELKSLVIETFGGGK